MKSRALALTLLITIIIFGCVGTEDKYYPIEAPPKKKKIENIEENLDQCEHYHLENHGSIRDVYLCDVEVFPSPWYLIYHDDRIVPATDVDLAELMGHVEDPEPPVSEEPPMCEEINHMPHADFFLKKYHREDFYLDHTKLYLLSFDYYSNLNSNKLRKNLRIYWNGRPLHRYLLYPRYWLRRHIFLRAKPDHNLLEFKFDGDHEDDYVMVKNISLKNICGHRKNCRK
jgi:hypothetical protein